MASDPRDPAVAVAAWRLGHGHAYETGPRPDPLELDPGRQRRVGVETEVAIAAQGQTGHAATIDEEFKARWMAYLHDASLLAPRRREDVRWDARAPYKFPKMRPKSAGAKRR